MISEECIEKEWRVKSQGSCGNENRYGGERGGRGQKEVEGEEQGKGIRRVGWEGK